MLLLASTANAQEKNVEKKDSVPLLRGFAVSVDLVGPAQMFLGDYGQYEAALRINLRDKYFPVFELGLGKADHDNDVTKISYKTSAPYAKIGIDFNLLKTSTTYTGFMPARDTLSLRLNTTCRIQTSPTPYGEALPYIQRKA